MTHKVRELKIWNLQCKRGKWAALQLNSQTFGSTKNCRKLSLKKLIIFVPFRAERKASVKQIFQGKFRILVAEKASIE